MNSVLARVCILRTRDHCEKRRFAHLLRVHPVFEFQKIGSGLINPTPTEFHFYRGPPAVVQMDYDIGLQACLISVMEDLTVQELYISTQITDNKGFKERTERMKVPQ